MANYAASGLGEKTACVEIHGHGQLSQWKTAGSKGYFKDKSVYYYPDFHKDRIPILLNSDYERIILDFGDAYIDCRKEIMRCDRKIFLLNLNPWQQSAAKYLIRTVKKEEWGHIQPVFGSVKASKEVRMAVEKEFQIHIEAIPLLEESCCIPGEAFSGLNHLIGFTAAKKRNRLRIPTRRKI